ncbi:cadmium-translocating P-type ATPase (plasmid) [Roseomonas marmotae]|uniref:P-type Zn(2+) transporter n=2 Tax=Roseomonas marmotae TaxID=2768161 RepID=A0ABS3KGD5_9PROT|nr:cadmium-translocating P-type ATPase [Roseomonas marmotae]QTI82014.1 cadmium-translocating P-type ATPase [Roseomonas marmotae]
MDCAACVAKVEKAIGRLPGISDIRVNLMGERLSLRREEGGATAEAIERRVAALGYRPTPVSPVPRDHDHADEHGHGAGCCGHDHDHRHNHDHGHHRHGPDAPRLHSHGGIVHAHGAEDEELAAGMPWWRTGKARLVFLIGGLVALAWALAHLMPSLAGWFWLAATLAGLFPFGRRALLLARAGSPFSIETLMSVAALGAILIGAVEEAALVVFLFALGEVLENVAAGRARAGIRALVELLPRSARRETPSGGTEEVPASALRPGDIVRVRPGDRLPCDGEILEGRSAMDESPVTGESMPVARGTGDAVMAGSISTDGALRLRVTRGAGANTLARIQRLVEEATASRAPTQRFIERFSAWWTPAAMVAAASTMLIPPLAFGAEWGTWFYRGLALLLVACPCALVISVPAAMASGLSAGARRGLLVKGGAALEAIGGARTIAFDKTGTLTEGRPRVTDLLPLGATPAEEALRLAAAVEQSSGHPLAKAILAEAEARGITPPPAAGAGALAGRAAHAVVEGRAVSVGSPHHAAESGASLDEARVAALEAEGKTVVAVVADGVALALIALRDEPREDAAAGIAALRGLGLRPVMLTGDNPRTGAAIGGALGMEVEAGLLPADKLRHIGRLKQGGAVAMVGDGINDAPALAAASVGIAMGGGTDVALETADAALLRGQLSGVAELVALSRATLANIRQNVAIAVGLKLVLLVTTLLGVTGLWPAIMADTGATVLVTLNALRLLAWRPRLPGSH